MSDLAHLAATTTDINQPNDNLRLGNVTQVDWSRQPPLVYVNGRPMRFLAGITPPFGVGDTAVWIDASPAPLVIGRPQSQTTGTVGAWQTATMINTWTAYGAPFATPRYFKDPDGWVYLSGLSKTGNILLASFTLPAAYAPDRKVDFSTLCGNPNGACRMPITPDGNVGPYAGDAGTTNAFLSYDGIRFMSAGARRDEQWDYCMTLNGWGDLTLTDNVIQVFIRDDGLCQLSGTVSGGTTTAGTVMLDLPWQARTRYKHTFNNGGYNGTAYTENRIDVSRSSVQIQAGPNNEVYLHGIRWWSKFAESKWTVPTLQNSWARFDNWYSPPGYLIDKYGVVHLRGLLKSGTVSATLPIFTLPAGFRPGFQQIFPASHNMPPSTARIDVYPDGRVCMGFGNNGYLDLSQTMFLAEG